MPRARGGELAHPEQAAEGVRAAATFTSRCVSTPPVTGRVGSTIVIAIPSLVLPKGWHALHQVCGAGAIALLAQGGPPHPSPARATGPWSRSADRISRQADRQPILEPGRDPVRLTVLGSISAVVGPIQVSSVYTPCRLGLGDTPGATK